MYGYGKPDEMRMVLHEWTGTGVRDIKTETALKSDTIWTLIDEKEKRRYIGCTRAEWDKIRDSAKVTDTEYKIEGYNCKFAYGPGDYLIFQVK